jgi:hypothetical protein
MVDDSQREDGSPDATLPSSIDATYDFAPISPGVASTPSNAIWVAIADPGYCLDDLKRSPGVSPEQVATMFLQCRKQGRGTMAEQKLWKQAPLENGPAGRFALQYDGHHFTGFQIQLFKEDPIRDKKSCPFGCISRGGIRQSFSGTTYPLTSIV